jgi:mono/diheme cytochrome c family protein
MRSTWGLVVGVGLVVVGLVGIAVVGVLGALTPVTVTTTPSAVAPPTPPQTSAADLGREIYITGATPQGPILSSGGPVWFQRMHGGCALCHGADGQGRTIQMMGAATVAPDIRYTTLSQVGSVEPSSSVVGPWTDSQIIWAITAGQEPNGARLNPDMPLWTLDDAEAQALLAYLKEL